MQACVVCGVAARLSLSKKWDARGGADNGPPPQQKKKQCTGRSPSLLQPPAGLYAEPRASNRLATRRRCRLSRDVQTVRTKYASTMKVVKVFVKQDPSMDLAKYKVRGFVRAWETTGRCACREPASFLAPCWPRAPPVGGVSPVCVGMAGVALCAFGFSSGCLCRLLATGQSRMAAQGAARQRQRLLFRGERAAGFSALRLYRACRLLLCAAFAVVRADPLSRVCGS